MKLLIKNVVLLMIIGIIRSTVIAGEINQIKDGEQSLVTSVIDRTITYQGLLKNSSGTPVPNSTYNLTFRIYNQSSGGLALWTSIAIPVMTSSGLFSTLLGPISLPFDTTYYISIQVAGDVEMSRQAMTMSPYSASADTANYAKAAISDSKWAFWITDTADTTLMSGGQWGIARYGNVMWGNADSTHVNLGVQSITGSSGDNNKYCAVGGGLGNYSKGEAATISGGAGNVANGHYSSIGGGGQNTTNQNYSVISGGTSSTVSGYCSAIAGGGYNTISSGTIFSTIGGGDSNTVSQGYSAISGGHQNTASGSYSAIGGGSSDTVMAVYGGAASGYSNLAGDAPEDTGAFVGGGYNNSAIGSYSTVEAGKNNTASSYNTTVSGGSNNTASYTSATVGGGSVNTSSGQAATVPGGANNTASGHYSTVGGGYRNFAGDWFSTIGGGSSDTVKGVYGGVASGYSNTAGDAPEDTGAFVGGGNNNSAIQPFAIVTGGKNNTASGYAATVGGGSGNTASGAVAEIGGGIYNTASGNHSTVSAGYHNNASGTDAAVGGGISNTASGTEATVGGGYANFASNQFATVGGGYYHTASGISATIGGGYQNTASGAEATVGGGEFNAASGDAATIGGGSGNRCGGDYSCIPGGLNDTIDASGDYSLVFGNGVYCNDNYRVSFFDGANNGCLNINRDGRDGYLGYPIQVGTGFGNGGGAYLSPTGVWTNSSSRTFKENFTPFDGAELLRKISALSVTTYNYKNSTEKHIGPVAEEFVGAFDTGVIRESDGKRDDQYLAGSDVAGVALAGVQELLKKIDQLEKRIAELEANQK
jgi:hypothetical protein